MVQERCEIAHEYIYPLQIQSGTVDDKMNVSRFPCKLEAGPR